MNFWGIPVVTSHYLTVAGEPVERLAPDFRERMARNERKALAHAYAGIVRKPATFESLSVWRTPQVPDPNVYMVGTPPKQTAYCHPVVASRLEEAARKMRDDLQRSEDDITMRAWLYR